MEFRVKSYVSSKWDKTAALIKDKNVRSYVPETLRMNSESLRKMLNRYSMVYIKPVSGTYGKGVMRVEQVGGQSPRFSYQLEFKKRTFTSFDSLYHSILEHKRKGPYLVQQGIKLLTHNKRRFDVRVMVQRNEEGIWETTGIIGRVSHPEKIVTNYHSGGTPMKLRPLLKTHLGSSKAGEYERVLAKLGVRTASVLSKEYPKIQMIGADIGIDSDFNPWIIEINTKPDPYIFKHLKDRSVYRKVLRYYRAVRKPQRG